MYVDTLPQLSLLSGYTWTPTCILYVHVLYIVLLYCCYVT